jgi:cytochrome P450
MTWTSEEVLPGEILAAVMQAMDRTPKMHEGNRSHDVLGGAYEYLLKRFSDGAGPELRQLIIDVPEVIPNAVEELLRCYTPVPMVIRWSREATELGGLDVTEGATAAVNISAANVDPDEYEDPLVVRFDREVNKHLAFGGGVHRGRGSHLARRELRVALREWHRRIPHYELAPGYEVTFQPPLRFGPDLELVWNR